MSAPTKPKKGRLSIIALLVASLALLVSIAALGDVFRASRATYRQPADVPSVQNHPVPKPTSSVSTYLPSGPEVTNKKQREFLDKGEDDVMRWGRERFGKDANRRNMALAYLCLAKFSEAGRYYAGLQVDIEDQFYGIGSDGTRRGDPAKTARAVCATTPTWAKG